VSGGTQLRAILTGSPLATSAGDKVRPDMVDERDRVPFIIFRRTQVERIYGLDNTVLATREDFDIECWGDTPSKAQDLEAEVVAALAAAGIPVNPNDPDGNDPVVGVNAVVVRVSLWVDP
jgi:hypothetical protein